MQKNTDHKPKLHKNYKLALQIWLVNNNVVPGQQRCWPRNMPHLVKSASALWNQYESCITTQRKQENKSLSLTSSLKPLEYTHTHTHTHTHIRGVRYWKKSLFLGIFSITIIRLYFHIKRCSLAESKLLKAHRSDVLNLGKGVESQW